MNLFNLFISFLIALAIYFSVALIGKGLKKLIKKYGFDVVIGGVINCCVITLLTLLMYSLMMTK